jgi:hypothetical protein
VLLLLLQAAEKDELSARAKGDVVAGLLPLVDNFELARTQVKPETEGEQKINNSYQVRPAACPAAGPCWSDMLGRQCCWSSTRQSAGTASTCSTVPNISDECCCRC